MSSLSHSCVLVFDNIIGLLRFDKYIAQWNILHTTTNVFIASTTWCLSSFLHVCYAPNTKPLYLKTYLTREDSCPFFSQLKWLAYIFLSSPWKALFYIQSSSVTPCNMHAIFSWLGGHRCPAYSRFTTPQDWPFIQPLPSPAWSEKCADKWMKPQLALML